MGVHAIGDRVYLIDMIGLLKKKKKELETSATLWSGETPAQGFGMFTVKAADYRAIYYSWLWIFVCCI